MTLGFDRVRRALARAVLALGMLLALLLALPGAAWAGCLDDSPDVEPHEQNYVLIYSEDRRVDRARDGRKADEAIFQISLRKNILSCDWVPLYFGYTQRSYWQVYDREGSAPFRESNYHPELFLDYALTWLKDSRWGLRAGIEHESNGQRDPLSRSWNRTYGKLSYAATDLAASLRFWQRWEERAKNPPQTLQGDDNPDLVSYRGSWEAQGIWRIERVEFGALVRRGKADRGRPWSGQFDVDWVLTRGFAVRLEVYRGYGDSLIDYNRDVTRIGIGLALKNFGASLRPQVR